MNQPFELTGVADEGASSIVDQIACHLALGWNHLELRSVDGLPIARLTDDALRMVVDQLQKRSIAVPVLASQIGNWGSQIEGDFAVDLTELDRLLEIAATLGTRMIRIMSYPNSGWEEARWRSAVIDRLCRLTEIAQRHDVVLVHENCAGWAGRNAEYTLDMLQAVGSDHLKLLFDVGNGLSYGYQALDFLRQVLPHVAHVHLKDGLCTDQGVRYQELGEGEAGAIECIDFLIRNGYEGWFSIEPHLSLIPHLQVSDADPQRKQATYMAYAQRVEQTLNLRQRSAHVIHG
ncbi:sugar phosphate isomerase/epimerase family protein [Pseudomonas sp. B329]|uniref:sugar phosphate isomerase/epimerase family protein n=1 Tax=Pseudomonas sp. B329 TaxID=1553459 RepID=UPI002003A37A|nr:sugar phosphate isomerase/epimerase family protein [Pseudomonas sp. B329]MCK3860976.1 sugar phosphate isomerase/epimerase [Pseudomonas sp. B329]